MSSLSGRAVDLYLAARRLMLRVGALTWCIFTGFWLGVLNRKTLHALDDIYYGGRGARSRGATDYYSPTYNRRGLWLWERQALDRYFPRSGRLGVLAAGGGREVLALRKRGYEAIGWECQEGLVKAANNILVEEGFGPEVMLSARDTYQPSANAYAGFIIGWGAYTLIQGRAARVELLRSIRENLDLNAPLLLSFFSRRPGDVRFTVAGGVARVLRYALWRERVEIGDYLEPNYVHYFVEDEVCRELREAGFALDTYRQYPYSHAIARRLQS